MRQARASTAPIPAVSGPSPGPGLMYPNPPVSTVPGAASVEDVPYATELIQEGWFLPEYAELGRADLKAAVIP